MQGGDSVLGRIPTANLPLRRGLPHAVRLRGPGTPTGFDTGTSAFGEPCSSPELWGCGGLGQSRTDILRIFSPALHPRFSFQPVVV